jgi:membrane protein
MKFRVPQWLQRAARPVYPLYRAVHLWSEAGGMRMSAAMSFYGVLSLAPLLLAIIALLGWLMDRQALEQQLLAQLGTVIGDRGASLLADALTNSQHGSQGHAAGILGFAVLLFGATGAFNELQDAFERVWTHGRPPQPRPGFWHAATLRLRGIGYILVFGFLLLVSLVVSTLLALFSGWAGSRMPVALLLSVLNEVVAFVICAALFAGLMRLSSGPKPRSRFLVVGACAGAILFTIGRQLLTLYLARAAVVSAYGAAGSLIVLLMWIYFSSAVLLFGAGCARALEEHVGARGSTRQEGAALGQDQGERGGQPHGQQQQQAPAVAGVAGPHQA